MAFITTTLQNIGSGINYLTILSNDHPYINGAVHLGLVAYGATYGDTYLTMGGYAVATHIGLVTARIAFSAISLALNPPAVVAVPVVAPPIMMAPSIASSADN